MNPDAAEDRRRFHRIIYNADATLSGNGIGYECKVIDLSLKGCLVQIAQPWSANPDALYTLILNLSADDSILMDLHITHVDGDRVGLKCTSIDIDSISNLRRLVELNLGDSELLERELSSLNEVIA